MEYYQKKGAHEIKLSLEKEHLRYFIKDTKSKGEFIIPYEQISLNQYELIQSNDTYKHYANYHFIIGLVFLIVGLGVLFLISSAIFFYLYKRSKITFTIIEANGRRIYVLHDNQHEEIINNIYKMRRDYLKHKYAIINIHNHPDYELERFQLLLEQKIITEEEFNELKFQLLKKDDKILN